MVFYFDENMPKRIAQALDALEGDRSDINVFSTEIVWDKGIDDPTLFRKISEVGGILITNDLKIKTRRNQFELLKELELSAFLFSFPKHSKFPVKYMKIFSYWEFIKKTTARRKLSFICKIKNNGTEEFL